MSRFTIYIGEIPTKNFDDQIEAEDFTRSLPDNVDFTVWDNINDCEFSFLEKDIVFDETKQFGDITRRMIIYRFNHKITACVVDKCKDWDKPRKTCRNFIRTQTFKTYKENVERAKKYFGFEKNQKKLPKNLVDSEKSCTFAM